MDPKVFDDVARSVASGVSRRGLLRAGLAIAAGVAGLRASDNGADAAAPRRAGQVCRKDGDCASGTCGPRDSRGRGRCLCADAGDCPVPRNGCTVATCSPAGVCGTAARDCDDGDPCTIDTCNRRTGQCVQTPVTCVPQDACHTSTCDATSGQCVQRPITCSDDNICTVDTCDPQVGCVFTAVDCPSGQCDPVAGCLCASDTDCPDGRICLGGGCFLLNPGATSQVCIAACGLSYFVTIGGQTICAVPDLDSSCSGSVPCPAGQTCFSNTSCVAPC